jgi:hypothetical protein
VRIQQEKKQKHRVINDIVQTVKLPWKESSENIHRLNPLFCAAIVGGVANPQRAVSALFGHGGDE